MDVGFLSVQGSPGMDGLDGKDGKSGLRVRITLQSLLFVCLFVFTLLVSFKQPLLSLFYVTFMKFIYLKSFFLS